MGRNSARAFAVVGQTGVWFHRQVVVGGRYIADFVAPRARLIVEVDGAYHARRGTADARRDRTLAQRGYKVLRLDAELILNHPKQALALIRAALRAHPENSAEREGFEPSMGL